MRALVAFDKFKDALTAVDACQTAADALSRCQPDWDIETAPLADGGDGFCDTLTNYVGGAFHKTTVTGPLGGPVEAQFGIVSKQSIHLDAQEQLDWAGPVDSIAIVELAQSSGISLTPLRNRSPWTTTTAGLGELLLAAIAKGAQGAIIGLGGSATHDLALGALWKLGFTFRDAAGALVDTVPTPERWERIESIQLPLEGLPREFQIRIACDVENPLLGPSGAAAVFGPQKGLTEDRYDALEAATARMANQLLDASGQPRESLDAPGTGAAGGAAFGLQVGLGARLLPGYELVKRWIGLDAKFDRSDLVLTGEGRFDASSLQGKGPGSLALEATRHGKPAYVFAGSLGDFDAPPPATEKRVAVSPPEMPLEDALKSTASNLGRSIQAAFATDSE